MVGVADWQAVAGSALILCGARGYLRARTMHIWHAEGRAYRQSAWQTVGLWVLTLGLHLLLDAKSPASSASAVSGRHPGRPQRSPAGALAGVRTRIAKRETRLSWHTPPKNPGRGRTGHSLANDCPQGGLGLLRCAPHVIIGHQGMSLLLCERSPCGTRCPWIWPWQTMLFCGLLSIEHRA